MATYTTSLRLTQPTDGDTNWGATVNNGITALVDSAVAGTASITMTAANYTLSNTNGAADEARCMFLSLGGTPGASYNVVCPAVSKLYLVTNNTGYSQTLKTPAGTGVSIPTGVSMVLYCNGTNVVSAFNYMASLSLGASLPVASGGTGTTTSTGSGAVVLSNNPTLARVAVAGNAQTAPVAVAFSATAMTVDCTLSNVFTTTFTANVTVAPTISNPQDGQTINWFITQDGTGGRTMTWPTSFKWPGGVSQTLSTTGSAVDLLTATYRSATGFWYVTLVKAFS